MYKRSYFNNTKPINFFKILQSNRAGMMLVIIFFSLSLPVLGQGNHDEKLKESKNAVFFSLGFTHIPSAGELNSTEANGFYVPNIGLDYVRRFGKKWELGVMLDWELAHYVIVPSELERENAFIIAIGPAVRLIDNLFLFAGPGLELEKNKKLFVLRTGLEYGVHFKKNWVMAPGFFFDWKEDYYTYTLALTVGYNFH